MKSFLAYMGGKSLLAGKIIPMIPDHHCYVEVFCGAAWLLFKKDENISQVEIINDINKDLVTLYRVIKYHLEEFVKQYKHILVARDEFERARDENPDSLTDIQRAARFYYLLKAGYAAKIPAPAFSICTSQQPRLNLLRVEEELSAVHLRLARVYVENKSYKEVIPRFDKQNTFFYIDPPYYGFEDCYGKGIFDRGDFYRLSEVLAGLQGKFILSLNNTKEVREIFKRLRIETARTRYIAAGADKQKKVTELLIMNYDPIGH
jgi:DNA adenine methylase